jgi:hypothetical protein
LFLNQLITSSNTSTSDKALYYAYYETLSYDELKKEIEKLTGVAETYEEFCENQDKVMIIYEIIEKRKKKQNDTYLKIWDYIIKLNRYLNFQKYNLSLNEVLHLTYEEIELMIKEIEKNPYKGF